VSRQGWLLQGPPTAKQLEGVRRRELRRGAVRRTRKPAGGTGKMMTRA